MPKSYCGKWLYFNQGTGECQRFFCGEGTCERPECQKRFWLSRVNLVSALIADYGLDKFFTLTLSREMPLEVAWGIIATIWNKFLTVVRRKYPEWLFVAVLESHEDGYPHIHGFTQTWMSQDEYSKHWYNCGGGYIVWVERVKCNASGDVADYVCKQLGRYVGKQNLVDGKIKRGKGKRTIWRSQKMKSAKELVGSSGKWQVLRGNFFDKDGKPLYTVEKISFGFIIVHEGSEHAGETE